MFGNKRTSRPKALPGPVSGEVGTARGCQAHTGLEPALLGAKIKD